MVSNIPLLVLSSTSANGDTNNGQDEKNVLLEFKTNQHFVFPEGGGNAIINTLFEHMKKYDGLTVMWETEGYKLLINDDGSMRGVKVRKNDGRLYDVLGKTVMLSCGGFEGNPEMLAQYVGNKTGELQNPGAKRS